jgi:tetratricopeptide (TPR) repeat protein
MSENKQITKNEAHLLFAKTTFNNIWSLLEKKDRSPAEDEDILLNAFTSLYHWKQVGKDVNFQRGYWMLSRVYQTLGQAEQALEWGLKCHRITQDNTSGMEDFDLAYAEEIMARAYAMNGDLKNARDHYQMAVDLGNNIKDPDDKKIFFDDFQGGEWYQLGD